MAAFRGELSPRGKRFDSLYKFYRGALKLAAAKAARNKFHAGKLPAGKHYRFLNERATERCWEMLVNGTVTLRCWQPNEITREKTGNGKGNYKIGFIWNVKGQDVVQLNGANVTLSLLLESEICMLCILIMFHCEYISDLKVCTSNIQEVKT